MKKILVVDCNAKLGGIQKALISFLKVASKDNEVSVLYLNKFGCLLKDVPESVRIYTTKSDFRFMGMSQADCSKMTEKIKRSFYVIISRCFGQKVATWIAGLTMRDIIPDSFDEVISYSHMSGNKSFYGGTPQYVLKMKNKGKRICYIHCDYLHSGNRSKYSDSVYSMFDEIVCVSESTRNAFLTALPQLEEKISVKYNYINGQEIRRLAMDDPYIYDEQYINAIIVARMTKEKGIERIVNIFESYEMDCLARIYIVGDGKERKNIEEEIKSKNLEKTIILLGEQENPYRYMANADFLIVPSYHEAAPVIFQEAIELDLPVLTTRTTSADEMIGDKYGMVVDNDDNALKQGIYDILEHPQRWLRRFK